MSIHWALVFGLSLMPLAAENWPQWRGPSLNGVSTEKNLPLKWSPTENLAWKLALPEVSGSSPVVWGDTVFLSVSEQGKISLWAIARKDGAVLWKKPVAEGDYKVRKGNMSSPSPVTDGKMVWMLTGTGVVKCFDFQGNEKWTRDLQHDYGKFGLNHGYGSSPLLVDQGVYVQVLHGMKTDDPSYIVKIDKITGKVLWRVERPTAAIMESPDSYTTPMIAKAGARRELIIAGGDVVTGHDLETGKELWRGGGFNPDNNPFNRIIASPVTADDMVYTATRVKPYIAYRAGGSGDVTATHQVWKFMNGPDVPTPTLDDKYLYTINDRGIAYCLDRMTGQEVYGGQRLRPGTYSASPVLADGKIYITSEDGVVSVLKAGSTFEVLAENEMHEYTLSTIAVSGGQLFLRTAAHLYAIGKR